jgi:hypothetical protein
MYFLVGGALFKAKIFDHGERPNRGRNQGSAREVTIRVVAGGNHAQIVGCGP